MRIQKQELKRLAPVLAMLNGEWARKFGPSTDLTEDVEVDWDLIPKAEDRLREWVKAWRPPKHPPRDRDEYVGQYIFSHPRLERDFDRVLKVLGITDDLFRSALAFQRGLSDDDKVSLVCWQLEHGLGEDFSTAFESTPLLLFLRLLRSPLAHRLKRCAKKNCDRFFLDLRGQKQFCCRAHAQDRINQQELKERKEQRKARLAEIQKAIDQCTEPDWKRRIAEQMGVTRNFLTYNIHTGALKGKS